MGHKKQMFSRFSRFFFGMAKYSAIISFSNYPTYSLEKNTKMKRTKFNDTYGNGSAVKLCNAFLVCS
jgi:hypothetical protein